MKRLRTAQTVGSLLIFFLLAVIFVWAFSLFPVDKPDQALDWKNFYLSTHGFRIDPDHRVFNPPWTLALLWPFTAWSLPVSRGLAAFVTLIVFVLCVPRNKSNLLWLASIFLLLLSYPMLRNLIDGNLEALILGGALLGLCALRKGNPYLFAIGILFLSAKIQESWLLLIFLIFDAWRNWPRSYFLKTTLGVGIVIVPFLAWKWNEWFQALQSFPYENVVTNSSMRLVMTRLGLHEVVVWIIWFSVLLITLWVIGRPKLELNSEQAGLLILGGLLLSNYAGALSLVTVVALGVLPIFQRKPIVGLGLLFFNFLPYAFLSQIELRFAWENVYWAGVLVLIWVILVWELKIQESVSVA